MSPSKRDLEVIEGCPCPVCHAPLGAPCSYVNRWKQPVVMKHPHSQRVRHYGRTVATGQECK